MSKTPLVTRTGTYGISRARSECIGLHQILILYTVHMVLQEIGLVQCYGDTPSVINLAPLNTDQLAVYGLPITALLNLQ